VASLVLYRGPGKCREETYYTGQKSDTDEDVVSSSIFLRHGTVARWCMLMGVVRLGVSVGLWSPRSPTISTSFEFIPYFPIPAGMGTAPLRRVTRFLPRENVICVLYRAEPFVSYPFRKVRGSAVMGIRVVNPNEFVIFRTTISLSPVSESLLYGDERSGRESVADATGTEIGSVKERQWPNTVVSRPQREQGRR